MNARDFVEAWGDHDLIRPAETMLSAGPIPEIAKQFLLEAGLPLSVVVDTALDFGFTFESLKSTFQNVSDIDWPEEVRRKWQHLWILGDLDSGFDSGAPNESLCIDATNGSIVLFNYEDERVGFVNSSLPQFAESCLVMRTFGTRLSFNAPPELTEHQASAMTAELKRIDAAAFQNPKAFWPEIAWMKAQAHLKVAVRYRNISAQEMRQHLNDLIFLVQDAVDSGASIGFLAPLSVKEATAYWHDVLESVRFGSRTLWVAETKRDGIIGSVQLGLEQRTNQRHRAEVMKLLVHTGARRQGIGRELMKRLEVEAKALGRTTLVLDTREGDPSNALYQSLGWTLVGPIPEYCRNADGTLAATMIYYKLLEG
jgi:acetyltransferase